MSEGKSQPPSLIEGGPSTQTDNKQGTFYQSTSGTEIKRKHFFSPLDHSLADAVHKDAADVEYTPEEEASLTKADFAPTLFILTTRHCSNASKERLMSECSHW